MRIGIEDSLYQSLTQTLIQEGHEVVMFVDDIPFDDLWPWKGVEYVRDRTELLKSGCEFIVGAESIDGDVLAEARMRGVPVIGHDHSVVELEMNRALAFDFVDSLGLPYFCTPTAKEFTDRQAAIKFLKTSKKDWVLKQHRSSPLGIIDQRTVVSRSFTKHQGAIALLSRDASAWFTGDKGGVRLEEYVEGVEVCFGMMLSKSRCVYPAYWCQEYKDAQASKSGVLTGEVGTLIGTIPLGAEGRIGEVFDAIASRLRAMGITTSGMLDFNTIIAPDGKMYFIEFTSRWGRPTMDIQIAMSRNAKKPVIGNFLRDVAAGRSTKFPYHYQTALGVTVYEYGLPYREVLANRKAADFKPPKVVSPRSSAVVPVFVDCSNRGHWVTMPSEGRYLVSVGLTRNNLQEVGAKGWELRLNAYDPLRAENFTPAQGMTWRHDIGDNLEKVVGAVVTQLGAL